MQQVKLALEKMHDYSDRTRYIFAALSFTLAVIVVLIGLSAETSSYLGRITGETAPELAAADTGSQNTTAGENQQPLSPIAGIGESFKGIEKVIPQLTTSGSTESWEVAFMRIGASVIEGARDGIVSLPQTLPKLPGAAAGVGEQVLTKAEEFAASAREYIYANFSRGHADN